MKKILLSIFLLLSSLRAYDTEIKLTGEFSQELGNPFRTIFDKKNTTISINSKDNKVKLSVVSNLKDSIYNVHKQHPNTYILDNSSIKHIVKQYYEEEFIVVQSNNPDIEVNVLSGKVVLDYLNSDNSNTVQHLNKVNVFLKIEIIKKGISNIVSIQLDNKLGKNGVNYSWSLINEDLEQLNLKTLHKTIQNIIEYEIYKVTKG